MGEILGWIAMVFIVSLLVVVGFWYIHTAFFKGVPSEAESTRSTRKCYTVLRNSVSLLEELKVRDNYVPFLSPEEQKRLESVLSDFNNL